MTWSSTTIASCLSTRRSSRRRRCRTLVGEVEPDLPSLPHRGRRSRVVHGRGLVDRVARDLDGTELVLGGVVTALKTTFWSLSASNEHSLVCSPGVPQVSGLEAYAGSVGLSTPSTSRCSRRAVSPITWSRRSWSVSWSLASAASRSRKHPGSPRPSSRRRTCPRSGSTCRPAAPGHPPATVHAAPDRSRAFPCPCPGCRSSATSPSDRTQRFVGLVPGRVARIRREPRAGQAELPLLLLDGDRVEGGGGILLGAGAGASSPNSVGVASLVGSSVRHTADTTGRTLAAPSSASAAPCVSKHV